MRPCRFHSIQVLAHGQWCTKEHSSHLPSQDQAGRWDWAPFSTLLQAFSKPKDSKKPSSPTWSRSGTSLHHSTSPTSPWDDGLELSTLVFLSLKVDQQSEHCLSCSKGAGGQRGAPQILTPPHPFPSTAQHITEVAAANGEYAFKTLIQTPESVLALLSEGVPLEVGMQDLLWYLSPLPRPILIVYNFWAPEMPALFKTLGAMGMKEEFCNIVGGYVDMLSLIKEKLPKAPSYKLKNLLGRHRQQQLSRSSVLATAKALQELWGALKLPARADSGMVLTHCNLQSYSILLPLVREKLLTRRAAKILARRNLILCELEKV